LVDPSIRESFEQSRISSNRRHILVGATRIYIRSLLAQSDASALQQAERTIRNLLINGFVVDELTWNEFVQSLAQRDRLVDAFAICETYLMPRFPGWRNLWPNYIRKNLSGYQWMELRHYQVKKIDVLPRYKTFVILAQAFGRVQTDERSGIGYDHSAGAWTREILEKNAQMTVRAIESMPKTNDKLQWRYIQS